MSDDNEMTGEEATEAAGEQQGNWTIKAVRTRTRVLARTCATRSNVSTSEWLDWAVELAARYQGQRATLPPIAGIPGLAAPANTANSDGQPVPSRMIELAKLAVALTPPGRDSQAMRTMRSVVNAHATAMLQPTSARGVARMIENGNAAQPAEPTSARGVAEQ